MFHRQITNDGVSATLAEENVVVFVPGCIGEALDFDDVALLIGYLAGQIIQYLLAVVTQNGAAGTEQDGTLLVHLIRRNVIDVLTYGFHLILRFVGRRHRLTCALLGGRSGLLGLARFRINLANFFVCLLQVAVEIADPLTRLRILVLDSFNLCSLFPRLAFGGADTLVDR